MMVFQRGKGFLFKNRYIFLAFFVPFTVMFTACAVAGFFPFGENQVAVIDMYHQYFPFINELHEKLQNGGSLFYTWNGGMGTNFLTLLSYYAASPLYLFTIFVPDAYLMEAVTLIIFVKTGMAGAFMALYLRGMHGREGFAEVAFSAMYALCAYVMGYYWCLMWLDTVAILPLCMLGLNRLIDRGDFRLYTLSITALMITNYYTGGMVCIFIFFYFPVLYFSRNIRRGAVGCLRITGKAVLCSVTGIFLAGVLLFPAFLNMQNTYYIDSEMPQDSVFYHSLLDIITNFLPATELTVREGLPNVYCGLFSVFLLVFFLLSKKILLRKKLLNCSLLAFLILSLNWNKLDYIWHGFHFPNQLPFRYSFVVSFLVVALAYEAFLQIRQIRPQQVAAAAACSTLYILVIQKLYQDTFEPQFAYVCLLLLFAYSGFLVLYQRQLLPQGVMGFLLLLVVTGELLGNTIASVETVSYTNRDEYFSESQEVKKLVKETQKRDTDFYRMEMANPPILNSPMLYNYPGVSEFSSTVSGDMSYFLEHIGLEAKNYKNRYNYVMTTPVANAILGIKYIISRGQPVMGESTLTLAGGEELTALYENKYFLSAGYMAEPALIHNWDYGQDNPFEVLNDFVKLATGTSGTVFRRLEDPQLSGSNVSLGDYHNGYVSCTAEEGVSYVELTFVSPQEQQVYVYVETDGAETITAITGSGASVQLREDCGAVVSVGKCRKGEKVTIKINYEEDQANAVTAHVYGMDQSAWEYAWSFLTDETFQVDEFGDTFLEGSVTAKKDGYFITSIPYEKGWKLTVDGRKTEASALGNAFLAVPLKKGTHHIRLTYLPEGFPAGVAVTLCGIGILLALCLMRKRQKLWEDRLQQKWGREVEKTVKSSREKRSKISGLRRRRYIG